MSSSGTGETSTEWKVCWRATDIEVARAKQHTGEAEGIRFVYPGVHKLFVGKVKLQSSTRSARGGL